MNEYYFLFILALVYTIFASVQDLRKREIANWVNFSLIAFALSYRLFYSIYFENYQFIILGVLGLVIFFILGNLFYYSNVFAGGDAKLLMGFGLILPYQNYQDLLFMSISFIFILFLIGTIYSLFYSFALVIPNKNNFVKEFKEQLHKKSYIFAISLAGIVILILENIYLMIYSSLLWFFAAILVIMPVLYIYLEAVNKSCMIKLVNPQELTEGDWIINDIKVGRYVIKKSVHGLSLSDINILKVAKRKVVIKYGIPFSPSFLFALLIMGFFFLYLKIDFQNFFYSLF